MKKTAVLLLVMISIVGIYLVQTSGKKTFYNKASAEGYELAKTYCQSCHQFPDAGLLDKKTWANFVLPKMAGYLGFRYMEGGTYFEDGKRPEAMPLEHWKKIVTHYLREAPDTLERTGRVPAKLVPIPFSAFIPGFGIKEPATTFAVFLPAKKEVLFGDGRTQNLYWLQENGQVQDSVFVGEGVVHVQPREKDLLVLTMGVLHPSDERAGKLMQLHASTGKKTVVADSLQRPVYIEYADLNKDKLQDFIICEFGNSTGSLSWFENRGSSLFRKHQLRSMPGAVRTQVVDANGDSLPDIVALFAQADEGCFVFYNQGNGTYKERRILQLPPSFGSNYFELADFNGDGQTDIVATNGDNGDYPAVLKPYHGIRIYLNNGNWNFTEALFLPLYGASKAVARDFDGDGDLDIASISYFPDFDQRPQENFVYWANEGNLKFHPYTIRETALGRWLTMNTGDWDNDGDEDIILGNATFTLGLVPQWQTKKWGAYTPSVLVLKNNRY